MSHPDPDGPADPPGMPIHATDPDLRRRSAWSLWWEFGEQWRHCYLLLTAVFAVLWRVSAVPIPILEECRFMAGLHPAPVLLLMDALELMWVPPLVAAVLYAVSFAIPRLNTASAVAVSALCGVSVLAVALLLALIGIVFVG